jgi:hypothetical protein
MQADEADRLEISSAESQVLLCPQVSSEESRAAVYALEHKWPNAAFPNNPVQEAGVGHKVAAQDYS